MRHHYKDQPVLISYTVILPETLHPRCAPLIRDHYRKQSIVMHEELML
jgi:hypothetical protein